MPNTATRRRVPMWMSRWGLRAWSLLGAAGLFVLLMLVMRSLLKNGRAKAIRFSTLDGICEALECQPGDVLEWVEE